MTKETKTKRKTSPANKNSSEKDFEKLLNKRKAELSAKINQEKKQLEKIIAIHKMCGGTPVTKRVKKVNKEKVTV